MATTHSYDAEQWDPEAPAAYDDDPAEIIAYLHEIDALCDTITSVLQEARQETAVSAPSVAPDVPAQTFTPEIPSEPQAAQPLPELDDYVEPAAPAPAPQEMQQVDHANTTAVGPDDQYREALLSQPQP